MHFDLLLSWRQKKNRSGSLVSSSFISSIVRLAGSSVCSMLKICHGQRGLNSRALDFSLLDPSSRSFRLMTGQDSPSSLTLWSIKRILSHLASLCIRLVLMVLYAATVLFFESMCLKSPSWSVVCRYVSQGDSKCQVLLCKPDNQLILNYF